MRIYGGKNTKCFSSHKDSVTQTYRVWRIKMITFQVENIERAMQWLKTCPFKYETSQCKEFIHIKIFVPDDIKVGGTDV